MSWRLDHGELAARTEDHALDDGEQPLSYRRFAMRAEAVADHLAGLGVAPGDRVALLSAGRGADEAVALAGILLAGACATPLEATAPSARWRAMFDAAGCRAIVHDGAARRSLRDVIESAHVELEDDGQVLSTFGELAEGESHEGAALLLHTSGSTGAPKPIPISWAAIDAFTAWMGELCGLAPGRRVLRVAELGFDLAIFDHLATWRYGATLAITGRRQLQTARSLGAAVTALKPNVIYGVPALMAMLTRSGAGAPAGLDRLPFAGEIFPPAGLLALARWAPEAKLFNLYGPTETNVCTFYEIDPSELDGVTEVPIGRACPYATCRVIDAAGETLEGPASGELVVSGVTALGGEVRTRDRVERDAEGVLRFRGRLDRMVKIGGRRVEPLEVETALLAVAGVREAAVVPVENARLGRRLVGHVVIGAGGLDGTSLRRQLRDRLPPHMVPDAVRMHDALPRTPNGKVDHAALVQSASSNSS